MTSTLVYDGDCGFCTTAAGWIPRLRLRADRVVAWQHADRAALGLPPAQCQLELQWVEDRGSAGGHRAIAGLLKNSGRGWALLGHLLLLPLVSSVAAAVYRLVAANRTRLPGGTPACGIPQTAPRHEGDQS